MSFFLSMSTPLPSVGWQAYVKNPRLRKRGKHYTLKPTLMPTTENELFTKAEDAAMQAVFLYELKNFELRMLKLMPKTRYKRDLLVAFKVTNSGEEIKAIWWSPEGNLMEDLKREVIYGNMDDASKQPRNRIAFPRPDFESVPEDIGFRLNQFGGAKYATPKPKEVDIQNPTGLVLSQGFGSAVGKSSGLGMVEEVGRASQRITKERPLW